MKAWRFAFVLCGSRKIDAYSCTGSSHVRESPLPARATASQVSSTDSCVWLAARDSAIVPELFGVCNIKRCVEGRKQ